MNGRLAALLILVALSGPAPGKPSSPAPVSQPAAVVDAFHDALRRGDTADAAALLSDDALIFESGGVERSKAEYAAHHLPADAAFAKGVSSQVTRRSGGSSGPLAWVASEGRTKGTYKGKPVDLVTTESMVLRRERATWRIVHIHWSSTTAR
jgi:ketosteroid isomerase-like protein